MHCSRNSSKELRELTGALAERRSVDDAARARVLAMGELLATTIGAEFLTAQGIGTHWMDARRVLHADERLHATQKASLLSATCDFAPDAALQANWRALDGVVITQGFIAARTQRVKPYCWAAAARIPRPHILPPSSARRVWRFGPTCRVCSAPIRALCRPRVCCGNCTTMKPRRLPATARRYCIRAAYCRCGSTKFLCMSMRPRRPASRAPSFPQTSPTVPHRSRPSPSRRALLWFPWKARACGTKWVSLADAFQVFKQHGLSVDLVSTSETNVTVSLDPTANTLDGSALAGLSDALSEICRVQILGPCASLSLLGQNIRGILHELGSAFELFQDQKIYLVTQAANDLNFTFVIDESQGDRLVQQLHERLVQSIGSDKVLGPTWAELFADKNAAPSRAVSWWQLPQKRAALLEIAGRESAAFVYDTQTLDAAIAAVLAVRSVKRWAYAMKANWHPDILRRIYAAGLTLECVSRGELEHAFASIPGLDPRRVLFTPNFAPRAEYEFGVAKGVRVTLDNLYPLKAWPGVFGGQELFLRIDPGFGRGHHSHVRTAGVHTKFGIPVSEIDDVVASTKSAGVRVTGLHAHTGSGIFDVANWTETGALLASLARHFPEVSVVDLGGGIGVPEQIGHSEIDLGTLDRGVAALAEDFPNIEFWMEPGRFLVAKAGVLLAQVTQLKGKGDVRYVGVATGMNSLIRPALYGAHHDIRNLTRIDEPLTQRVNVVGPICESADQLGADRWLPDTQEGDIILIANCGAYGFAMSSNYNRRPPAREFMI